MDKLIAYYTLPSGFDPNKVPGHFLANFDKFGYITFNANSKEEADFSVMCKMYDVNLTRNILRKVSGKDLDKYPYYYLSIKNDKNFHNIKEFMDFSSACPGGEQLRFCPSGVKQIKKISINPSKIKNIDILTISGLARPRVLIISSRLKQLLEGNNYSGFKTIPCLEEGKEYSTKEKEIDYTSKKIEEDANYFQLIITEQVESPASIGELITICTECSLCGTVHGFESSHNPIFPINGLKNTDFQTFHQYRTNNKGTITITGQVQIISLRILKLFLLHNIKGITSYTTHPLIKYGVVETENS